MDMHIEQVDPRDPDAFAAWFAVAEQVQQQVRPGEPAWLPHEIRASALSALEPDRDRDRWLLAARDGDQVVGAARVDLPLRDNLHLAEVELYTSPPEQCRGVARALLAELERRCRASGRTTLLGYSDEVPVAGGSPMSRGAGAALGFTVGQSEVRRDIDLPLNPDRVAALEAESRSYATDFDVVTWGQSVPEPLLADLAHLHQRMSTDIPLGELDITEESFDGPRVRRHERLALAMDRSLFAAGAIHRPSGRMVAYTDMAVPRAAARRAYQWNTIVLAEHRGHRLGTLIKLAALQELSAAYPQAQFITTWNAEENRAMIRVNDALGARVNGGSMAWQKRL